GVLGGGPLRGGRTAAVRRARGDCLGRRGGDGGLRRLLERVGQARHLGAEQLADLGQVRRHAFLLLVQVVDLALGQGTHPVGLGLGVGQHLVGLGLGLGHDLVGVLLGVADQLARVRSGGAGGLRGVGSVLGRALFGGGGALLGLGAQFLRGGLGASEPLGLLTL